MTTIAFIAAALIGALPLAAIVARVLLARRDPDHARHD